ncbi:hypothetical protein, partial [Desertimonas flava]
MSALLTCVGVADVVVTIRLSRLEPWRGPVIFSFSRTHGLDAGDVLLIPLVVVGIAAFSTALSSSRIHRAHLGGLVGPSCAVALGVGMTITGAAVLLEDDASSRWRLAMARVPEVVELPAPGSLVTVLVIGVAGCVLLVTTHDRARWLGRSSSALRWGAWWCVVGFAADAA